MFLSTTNHSILSPAAEVTTICRRDKRENINLFRERGIGLFCPKKMGSEGAEIKGSRKLRLLCLHGFRTSGEIIKKQVTGKWPESVLEKLDLVFADAPFPCQGKSDVEGIFDPPYYEWFQFNKEFSTYENFDECLAYIEDLMVKHGPFDGLLGFSQGAILSAGLAGMQAKGAALTRVPKIKLVVIIGGAKFRNPSVVEKAYSAPIRCRSVHFLGDHDFLKEYGTELLDSFVDPLVIRHPKGHTIPRFDEKGLESMLSFLDKMQKDVVVVSPRLRNRSLSNPNVVLLRQHHVPVTPLPKHPQPHSDEPTQRRTKKTHKHQACSHFDQDTEMIRGMVEALGRLVCFT